MYNKQTENELLCSIWQYQLLTFQGRDTKLEKFLAKNQHTQKNLLNFENLNSGQVSKFGHYFRKQSDSKIDVIKNVINKKCPPKFVFFNEKNQKDFYEL